MSSGLSPERSELAGAAGGGAGQFAQSENLEPRREQAQRDNGKKRGAVVSSGLSPERSKLAGAAGGGAGQFAQSENLEPRREQAQRDNGKKRGAVVNRRSVTTDDFGLDEEL